MTDLSDLVKKQVTASVDERLARFENQMSKIAQLLQHVQQNGINSESLAVDLEGTKSDCKIM